MPPRPPRRPQSQHSKSKVQRPSFGTHYRVSSRKTPCAQERQIHLQSAHAQFAIQDFVPLSQPTRKCPDYSWGQADLRTRERQDLTCTDEQLLARLNTIGKEEEDSIMEKRRTREELSRIGAKRNREEDCNRKIGKTKGTPKSEMRGWSWKGMKQAVRLH
ncbi:hypothetical protein CC78DRAFT_538702 [Lojkania enalia]|uniref:Uncharacterized protein n=1 Tax=Lojkania enalia TaxID=147567 RepID=A0A9P4ND29_9PLEO|nr:hypothetical protein CC78DRAFT_538702 [Didymosphaeria enalia]